MNAVVVIPGLVIGVGVSLAVLPVPVVVPYVGPDEAVVVIPGLVIGVGVSLAVLPGAPVPGVVPSVGPDRSRSYSGSRDDVGVSLAVLPVPSVVPYVGPGDAVVVIPGLVNGVGVSLAVLPGDPVPVVVPSCGSR